MCGIVAIYRYRDRAPVDPDELRRARDYMARRGPDGAGEWMSQDRRVGLGHRRLSIIDLSEQGAQPMATPDGQVIVVFNGEIYNYRSLRAWLESQGLRFRSTSDTEVLLQLYLQRGAEMFDALRGMYAFALWDSRKHGLLLARDPFGIKPLYIADDGSTVRVASEVKALLSTGRIDRSPDLAAHAGFFLWGNVPEPHTAFGGIRSLEPGSSLWIDDWGARTVRTFLDIQGLIADAASVPPATSADEAAMAVHEAIRDSVKHHLVADVDVGVFLSAGLDSTVLASIAAESTPRLKTVTLGFAEFRGTRFDETGLAERVARHIGSDHRTIWLDESDFRASRDQFLSRMDQPTIDGLNSYFVAHAAAQAGVKVALSGLGGDELFAGYESFLDVPALALVGSLVPLARPLGRVLRQLTAPIVGRVTSPKYASLLEYSGSIASAFFLRRALFMPWELTDLLGEEQARAALAELHMEERLQEDVHRIRSKRLQVTALESLWYMRNQLLRDSDWASMSHSVEVRVPLVDVELWRRVLPLAAHAPARINKRLMAGSPARSLPPEVLSRPKTGFFIPTRDWLVGSDGTAYAGRRLRGWARFVYARLNGGEVSTAGSPPHASSEAAARPHV